MPRVFIIQLTLLMAACSRPSGTAESPLTSETKVNASRNLKLSEVGLKATENYAGQTVTEIDGKIANNGDRVIHFAAVSCVFYDRYGQVVKRERVPLIKADLKPGETRSFRLPFDDVPESWNNQMPQLVIAAVQFA